MKHILVKFEGSPVQHTLEYDESKVSLEKGDILVMESSTGLHLSQVLSNTPEDLPEINKMTFEEAVEKTEKEVFSFVRLATAKDKEIYEENKQFAEKVREETKNFVKKFSLKMKISGVQVNLDKSKVVISFTAENRVDFRELVRELASLFKTRIELKQIGSRDETRIMGGIGLCGQQCCCKRFLTDFGHVSIKMAKNQNLSLNPNKISGICGRLLCCLGYENEHYAEMLKVMPKVNSVISTPSGKGIVVFNDLQRQTTQVKIGDTNNFEIKTFSLNELKKNEKGSK